MSRTLQELISSVMDGEADGSELKQTLDSLEKASEDQRGVWLRYHTYSAILRGEETSKVKRNHNWDALVAEFKGDINDGVPQPRILPFRSSYKNAVRNRWIVGVSSAMAASMAIVLSWALFFGVSEMPIGTTVQAPIAENESGFVDGQEPTSVADVIGEIGVGGPVLSSTSEVAGERRRTSDRTLDVFNGGTMQNDLQTVRYQLTQQDMEELARYLQLRNADFNDARGSSRNQLQTVSSPNSN